jgi:hypothetical protein
MSKNLKNLHVDLFSQKKKISSSSRNITQLLFMVFLYRFFTCYESGLLYDVCDRI